MHTHTYTAVFRTLIIILLSIFVLGRQTAISQANSVTMRDVDTIKGVDSFVRGSQLTFTDQTVATNLTMTHTTFAKTELNLMISGAAAGDFNNDGWQDLFVLGGGKSLDALFINQGNGTFTDQAASWGVAVTQRGAGAAVGDYNNDGWLDIFVTSHGITETAAVGQHRLYRNNGNGTFSSVAAEAGVNFTGMSTADGFGASFGDYDLDGDLDLFVAGWQANANNNRLFRNNGNGTFTNVTDSAGSLNNGLRGFSPCFVDMNGDHYPELLVAGDFNSSRYFVNNRNGTFTDQSQSAGVKIPAFGMGSTIGDFNNDGLFDWYVSSIYKASFGGQGNRLFMNLGQDRFAEKATSSGVADGRWGWGVAAVDLNNDSWLDIVETNGWPLEAQFQNQPARLWINQGNDTFVDRAAESGFVHTLDGRGLLNFDYDKDGDQDILITSNNEPLKLFRNDQSFTDQSVTDQSNHGANWLQIFLDTSAHPDLAPNGIGARVEITIGNATYVQTIRACSNFLSQSEMSAYFGIGNATTIDSLQVIWPNGQTTSLHSLSADQTLTLTPPKTLYLPIVNR